MENKQIFTQLMPTLDFGGDDRTALVARWAEIMDDRLEKVANSDDTAMVEGIANLLLIGEKEFGKTGIEAAGGVANVGLFMGAALGQIYLSHAEDAEYYLRGMNIDAYVTYGNESVRDSVHFMFDDTMSNIISQWDVADSLFDKGLDSLNSVFKLAITNCIDMTVKLTGRGEASLSDKMLLYKLHVITGSAFVWYADRLNRIIQ